MSDDAILDLIFHPNLDGVSLEQMEPPAPAAAPQYSSIPADTLERVRTMESEAILAAEQRKDYPAAISLLDQCIAAAPEYPSAYNNRAQARQLIVATAAASSGDSTKDTAALQLALADSDRAIELATGANDTAVLKQAYTQRALVRRALGQEEAALEDYREGARRGNVFAKKEAVRLNPYAALCNQYLMQAMENHWSGMGSNEPQQTSAAEIPAEAGGASASK
jgi:tetratricopeptide (TPR) repeat protein